MENSALRYIIKEILEKEFEKNEETLNESLKDWAIAGLITLSSVAGLTQTKQKIDPHKIEGAKEIQTRIENNDPELINLFSPKELKFIQANAEKLTSVDEKDFSEYNMQVMNSKNLKSAIANARVYGYAISDIKIQSDTIIPKSAIVFTKDTMVIEYDSDALFKTGEFNLTSESSSNILKTIQSISIECKITKLTIISSTDKEPIRMGNEQLALLRANSVQSLVEGIVDSSIINVIPLANQGPNLFSSTMTQQEKVDARKKTASNRFVKIIVEAEKEIVVETTSTTIPKIINSYKIELVKLISYGGGQKINGKNLKRKVYTKSKCEKIKYDGHMLDCTLTF
jgi:outer membrane protein OmpA-like peptidoglycan-associated protein